MSLLATQGLTRHFGGIRAVDGVDFELARGELRALIGPNGAGKSTFVGLLSGRIPASGGSVSFMGRDVTGLAAHRRARMGMAYTFQITSIFANLTVFENVALAARVTLGSDRRAVAAKAEAVLERIGLADNLLDIAGELSYGHKRLLEIALGLAQDPVLLILDEPTQGLAESEIAAFKTLMRQLLAETTILLIEHNMRVVMETADRVTVLTAGRVLAEGSPEDVRSDRAVQAAYLGSG